MLLMGTTEQRSLYVKQQTNLYLNNTRKSRGDQKNLINFLTDQYIKRQTCHLQFQPSYMILTANS